MWKLPFERALYDRAFIFSMVLAVIGWVAIFFIWGEFTAADIVGMIISVPIIAYLLHMLMLFNQLD